MFYMMLHFSLLIWALLVRDLTVHGGGLRGGTELVMRFKQWRWAVAVPAVTLLAAAQAPALATSRAAQPAATSPSAALQCDDAHSFLCTDVYEPTAASAGQYYVGHDEPAALFYSNRAGSGNNDLYILRLPKDPPVQPNQSATGGTANFQLHPAFWFGMAMCDTQSFPEHTQACAADSDSNIFNSPDPSSPKFIGNHPGTAFMEMQFYPPGWVSWPAGVSCDPTKWCAALNIDSYSSNPAGLNNNSSCLNTVGVEPVNFAFITKNGVAQAPANPVDATAATYTPDAAKDLFMSSGDTLGVSLHDTGAGFQVNINDLTRHSSGSMTASPGNGFGQVLYQPSASTCSVAPYAFHPMYSTSSPNTRVPWAAHSYNIAFSDEIGHFEYCNAVSSEGGRCTQDGVHDLDNGLPAGAEDDFGCFDAAFAGALGLVPIGGCLSTDFDFDGVPYQLVWPGTFTSNSQDQQFHPSPVLFTSPVFTSSSGTQLNYSRVAFETDLPRIEFATNPPCQR